MSCIPWWKARKRKRNNCCNVRLNVKNWWKTVFWWLTSVSARTLVTVLPSLVFSMRLVAAASTAFLRNISSTSAPTRRLSFASTADVSLSTRASSSSTKLDEYKKERSRVYFFIGEGCHRAAFLRLKPHLQRDGKVIPELFLMDGFNAEFACIVKINV